MLKSLLVLSLALTAPSFAHAEFSSGSISCAGQGKNKTSVTLKGFLRMFADQEADLAEVVATYATDGQSATGRAKLLEADPHFKPTKFKGHVRFDLSKLTNIVDFSGFEPADTCKIKVMIPNDAATKRTFEAPTQVSCDQSGGSLTLTCDVSKSRK